MLDIVVLGVNHKTAPLELRERLAFHPDECRPALDRLRRSGVIAEAALLSTCNRTEIYAATTAPDEALAQGRDLVKDVKGLDLTGDLSYAHRHREGVRHLLRVAGGVDSMVIGETAILGQVKTAFETAREAEALGPLLGKLFPAALHTGKRCRAETEIGRGAVSLEKTGVQLAERIFGKLESRSALVVGAGDSGQRVARRLRDAGVGSLTFANRTPERAAELADEFHGKTVSFACIGTALLAQDILVTAVSAPDPVVRQSTISKACDARRSPLLILDLGVPRNVEKGSGRPSQAFLYTVDDLQELVDRNLGKRREELPRAEGIVHEETERFFEWLQARQTAPTLVALREEAERLRQESLERFGKGLAPEERELLNRFSAGLVKKLMHSPTVAVRDCDPQTHEGLRGLDWARRLFGLDGRPHRNGDGPEEKR